MDLSKDGKELNSTQVFNKWTEILLGVSLGSALGPLLCNVDSNN